MKSGPRARTTDKSTSPRSEPALRALYNDIQNNEDRPDTPKRIISRLPSWQKLDKATSGGSPLGASKAEAGKQHEKAAGDDKKSWHRPSVDQMVEALRVAMMTKSTLDYLPLDYHSNIVHLIEAYGLMKEKLDEAEKQLATGEKSLNGMSEQFREKEKGWVVRETRYKAEIKRLELVIHDSPAGGLEAVTLARSGSLIKRDTQSADTGETSHNPVSRPSH